MNAALTNLQTKVDDNIEAKKTAAPDPSKVKAEDLSEVLTGVISYLDNLSAPPEAPAGVSFTTSPTFTLSTNSIIESASVVNDNGVTVNVAGATIAVPYAAAGKKRLDSIVVNYLASPAVYERIAGDEVAVTAIAARKPIPANRLFAHDIDVTDGAISYAETPGYTDAQAIAAPLTGYSLTGVSGDVAATDSIKAAIQKVEKKADTNATAKADKALTINTQTASYTLALSDAAGMVRMNVASANTLTIPPNSSVAFPVGTQIVISQAGAGQTTVIAGSGVTLNSFLNLTKLSGQYAGGTLVQVAANVWTLFGGIA